MTEETEPGDETIGHRCRALALPHSAAAADRKCPLDEENLRALVKKGS